MARAAIFGCLGPYLDPGEAAFFADIDPWGFILFARNIETPDQVRRLCADLRVAVGRDDAPVFIDQEGGRVARMRGPHWHEWVPPLEEAADAIFLRYQIIGAELRRVGITGNCAPVLDIAQPQTHPILRNRCFGTDPKIVSYAGRDAAAALASMGVMPVIKHMPGQGRATLDSHVDLPRVTCSLDDLLAWEFAPFRNLNDLPMAMTSHIVFEAIDNQAATFSPKVMDFVRSEIGFDGLIVTDDLSMNALHGSFESRTSKAYAAGCDIVLHCNGDADEMRAIARELRPLEGTRFEAAQTSLSCGKPQDVVDMQEIFAQYSAIKKRG